MSHNKQFLALDVGETRVGAAVADIKVNIAVPSGTFSGDPEILRREVAEFVVKNDINCIVIGYPRNQAGEPTRQTEYAESIAEVLRDIAEKIVFQDESLTSVIAEQRLKARGGTYQKEDIDAEAAVIILQDYLEEHA